MPKKIKDGTCVINLDEYADVGTHWIVLFCNRNEIVHFDCFGVGHIPEKIKKYIRNKNIKTFFKYKQTIQLCVGTFVKDVLNYVSR